MTRLRLIVVVVLGLLLVLPATAGAASRTQIIRDCEDDSKLAGNYTTAELRDARNNLPSDKDAYSDCRDVIGAAISRAARARAAERAGGVAGGSGAAATPGVPGGSNSGGGGGSAAPPLGTLPGAAPPEVSPEERKALDEARAELPTVDVRGQKVVPGVRGVAGSAANVVVPGPLVFVLVVLALTAALAAAAFLRRRVLGRRPV